MSMTLEVSRKSPLRLWQFSLRTILIVVAVAAIAILPKARQAAQERRLVYLVDQFNAAIVAQRYDDAESLVKQGKVEFPNEPVLMQMHSQVRIIKRLIESGSLEGLEGYGGCLISIDDEYED